MGYLDNSGLSRVFTKLKSLIDKKSDKGHTHNYFMPVTTVGTGAAYTATVDGITTLTVGTSITIVPHTVSTTIAPTLNVNGLGAKMIRRRLSNATGTLISGYTESWLTASRPVQVTYDGTFWVANIPKPNAVDMFGSVAIAHGGTGATTAKDALNNLGITWSTNAAPATGTPNSIYIQIV